MSWQILIASSVFLFSVSTILQKILLRREKIDPMSFSIFFQLTVGIIIGVYGLLTSDMTLPPLSPVLLNMIIMVLVYTLGNIFLFKSLQKIDASEFVVIFASRALFTIIASTLLLQESLTPVQFGGTLLVIASIALVSLKSWQFHFGKYEFFALLAAIFFGLANTNDRYVLGSFLIYPYVCIAFVVPALFTIPMYPKSLPRMRPFFASSFLPKILLLSTIYAASAIMFFTALQISDNSSQIASINLTSVIITVLLSIFFLGERNDIGKKIIGAVLSCIGVLLLS